MKLLIGPAYSGKTEHLLSVYRAALQSSAQNRNLGESLWIVPTQRATRQLKQRLITTGSTACFAPNILTFDDFAERILQHSHSASTAITESGKRFLLRQIIVECTQNNRLNYFASIAESAGLLDLVSQFITELKRDEIWPERFRAAIQQRGEREKDRELCLIYERYQQKLDDLALYDTQGRFWLARNAIQEGARAPFEQLSLVVVDGFSDFTQTQYVILQQITEWSAQTMITLPGEDPQQAAQNLNRTDLFAKSVSAAQQFRQSPPENVTEQACSLAGQKAELLPAHLRQLSLCLFQNPRLVKISDQATGLEILSVNGELREIQLIALRIKKMLLGGVAPNEIVVAVRALDSYADLIHEVFSAAKLPYWCELGQSIQRNSFVRFLMQLLQLEMDNWPFDRLMSLLRSNYFQPEWIQQQRCDRLRAVDSCLRKYKLPLDKQQILQSLDRLSQRDDIAIDQKQETELARDTLQNLANMTTRLQQSTDFATWVDRFISLVDQACDTAVPLSEVPFAAGYPSDQQVWQSLGQILYDAAATAEQLGLNLESLSLQQFVQRIKELVRGQKFPPAKARRHQVLVLEASDVRSLNVPVLFLAGLTETSFPLRRNDDCFYGNAERAQLNEAGLSLRLQSTHQQDEMLLFYGIVTSARQQLILSYPATSTKGEPLLPSPYIAAVQALFSEEALPVTTVDDFIPIATADEVLTEQDFRITAVQEWRNAAPSLFKTLEHNEATSVTARNIRAAVELTKQRFHTRGLTGYEGLLSNRENLQYIQQRFHRDYEYSATQLERYARCPYQFLVNTIFKIEPLEDPDLSTDYRRRGALVHEILSKLNQELLASGQHSVDKLQEQFQLLIAEQLEPLTRGKQLRHVLNELELQLLNDWAELYVENSKQYQLALQEAWQAGPEEIHLETEFAAGDTDQQGQPLAFGQDEQITYVQGRIDRIDVGTIDAQTVFNVIDYKTGKPPSVNLEAIQTGQHLQLAIYMRAALELVLQNRDAMPYQMAYWGIKGEGFTPVMNNSKSRGKFKPLEPDQIEQMTSLLHETVPRQAFGIRNGQFPVDSLNIKCTSLCPYSTICRVNEVRSVKQRLDKQRLD